MESLLLCKLERFTGWRLFYFPGIVKLRESRQSRRFTKKKLDSYKLSSENLSLTFYHLRPKAPKECYWIKAKTP
jgi:hypothetical protein